MKRAFLICPVRNTTVEDIAGFSDIVQQLENTGWTVHWPLRDTRQDASEMTICLQNLNAIRVADCVFVAFDPQSYGSHFDLGMAFALGKDIHFIKAPEQTEEKSFANLLIEWRNHILVHNVNFLGPRYILGGERWTQQP
jgi:nucleoside 2-deoxyribosyltransferase